MDPKFVNILLTLSGIFIGWLLTQVSAWYKGRKEDNRVRKQVLFNLLEINFLLLKIMDGSKSNFERLTKRIIEMLPQIEDNAENRSQLNDVFKTLYKPLLKEIFATQLAEIDTSFKASIQSLAPVDPLIAYYLNGKTAVFATLEHTVNKIIEKMSDTSAGATVIAKTEALFSEDLQNKMYRESLKEIQDLTADLAGTVGIRTKWKVKKLLHKPFTPQLEDIEFLETVDQFIKKMMEQLNQQV